MNALMKRFDFFVQSKDKKQNITVNIRRDLIVVNMCIYLLSERNSKDTLINESLLKLEFKDNKQKQEIDALCDKILLGLKETIRKSHAIAKNKKVVVEWCDSFWESLEVGRLFNSIHFTNMEFLAQQILYINFFDRKTPVFETMKWLQDEEMHESFFELLSETNANELLDTIYEDAVKCVKTLKG